MIFSEKLFVLRKSKGLTQEDLAEHLNVSRQAIAKWESGQAYPDISNIIAISEYFRVILLVPEDKPFRGPAFYQEKDYIYRCKLTGDMDWFQGHEEISYKN